MTRIVLTGGPGAGKTTVTSAIAAAAPDRFARVHEAATQVYDLLRTRWDLLDDAGRRDVQRRIYHLQRAQEDTAARANPGKVLLLDRGTVDGSGYWPDGPADYWGELGTTAEAELAKYDAVVWLETSAALPGGVYDRSASNARRFESADAAITSGEVMRALWSPHPRFFEVAAYPAFADKVAAVRAVLNALEAHDRRR